MIILKHLQPALALDGILSALAGCTAAPASQQSQQSLCDADAAGALVGKPKPTDADAMRLTRAAIVRQIQPGQPVTQDYRENRVTIEADPASGRVVRATCG
jgi:Peptidase inhibitor I78 family.